MDDWEGWGRSFKAILHGQAVLFTTHNLSLMIIIYNVAFQRLVSSIMSCSVLLLVCFYIFFLQRCRSKVSMGGHLST